jgi:signal peptidase I
MAPAILFGDHICVDKTQGVRRGDVIAFPLPEHQNEQFLKDVVGLPGDRLEFNWNPICSAACAS